MRRKKDIQTLLFNVGRLDLFAFAGMSTVTLGVALLASYIPALLASRVDPVVALRADSSGFFRQRRAGSGLRSSAHGADHFSWP